HGADRRAVAEMTADEPQFFRAPAQKFRGAQGDAMVGRSVKAVTAHTFLRVISIRQTVEISAGRQRAMKGGVEYGDVPRGGKEPAHFADARDVYRIVQRCERIERLD